jgi:hypothetical protein
MFITTSTKQRGEESMAILQEPVIGAWYLSQTGKLMKVRMLLYSGHQIARVLIEYLDGSTQHVAIDAWNFLDLNVKAATTAT